MPLSRLVPSSPSKQPLLSSQQAATPKSQGQDSYIALTQNVVRAHLDPTFEARQKSNTKSVNQFTIYQGDAVAVNGFFDPKKFSSIVLERQFIDEKLPITDKTTRELLAQLSGIPNFNRLTTGAVKNITSSYLNKHNPYFTDELNSDQVRTILGSQAVTIEFSFFNISR
jgi:hypothetical protein